MTARIQWSQVQHQARGLGSTYANEHGVAAGSLLLGGGSCHGVLAPQRGQEFHRSRNSPPRRRTGRRAAVRGQPPAASGPAVPAAPCRCERAPLRRSPLRGWPGRARRNRVRPVRRSSRRGTPGPPSTAEHSFSIAVISPLGPRRLTAVPGGEPAMNRRRSSRPHSSSGAITHVDAWEAEELIDECHRRSVPPAVEKGRHPCSLSWRTIGRMGVMPIPPATIK